MPGSSFHFFTAFILKVQEPNERFVKLNKIYILIVVYACVKVISVVVSKFKTSIRDEC